MIKKKKKRATHTHTKETTMDIFLKKVTPPQEQPQEDPSEGILEESIVIIGDHSSMCC